MRWCSVLLTLTVLVSLISCRGEIKESTRPEQEVTLVRVPPFVYKNLTPGENHCIFESWWHPTQSPSRDEDVVVTCKDIELPNDGVPLIVALSEARDVTLNGEPNGNLKDLTPLKTRLAGIFKDHAENKVLESQGSRIERSVGIRIPESTNYSEGLKIVGAVKEAGADPIILLLDGHLPAIEN